MSGQENYVEQRIKVDKDLIRMFREMTPEQRIAANDNVVRAIEKWLQKSQN